jgi:23S rRNA (adenine2503-C2)-methyltransferase
MENIKDYTLRELEAWMEREGEKPYRARQLFQWLYQRRAREFAEMTSISKAMRAKLAGRFHLGEFERVSTLESMDGSRKYVFRLADGLEIETVCMPGESHTTLCVSTQVGCAMGCDFCMTARMGLLRNLSAGEIVQQVVEASRDLPVGGFIRNIVFMGMGEPLHNYENLVRAIESLSEDFGFGFSSRRLTVSTAGLVPGIRRFIREGIRANLAVSLNAVDDELRSRLMPVNRRWNLAALLEACGELPKSSRIRITFEYVLLEGLNDSPADARRMVRLLHGLKCKVNLIPYNPPPGLPYRRPELERVRAFQELLLGKGLLATVRISRGQDIQAACGQLIAGERPPGGRFAQRRPETSAPAMAAGA